MSTKHTPGPWEWNDFGGQMMLVTSHGGKLVVLQPARKGMQGACFRVRNERCFMDELTPEHPDARLLAAAPDLLAAARAWKAVEDRFEGRDDIDVGEWLSLTEEAEKLNRAALAGLEDL